MKKFTHTGIKIGCDSRIPSNYKSLIFLRETKNFWIDRHGTKYRKSTGNVLGFCPIYQLDLSTIKEKQSDIWKKPRLFLPT
jgi:hypothetical protein